MSEEVQLGIYRHYKGKLYQVTDNKLIFESDLEPCISYKPLYATKEERFNGISWIRKKSVFLENTPEGKPRFQFTLPTKRAVICMLKKGNETLFIDYTNYPHPIHQGLIATVGGKIEEGESRKEAAIRETKEETGIIAKKLNYRGKVIFVNDQCKVNGIPMKYNFEVAYYDCFDFDASNAKATEGSLVWAENDKLSELKMREGDKIILDWLNKYSIFEGVIVQEGLKLIHQEIIASTLK